MEREHYKNELHTAFYENAREHEVAKLTEGQWIALGLSYVADAVRNGLADLGTADACEPLGALELLSKEVREGSRAMAEGLHFLSDSVKGTKRLMTKK